MPFLIYQRDEMLVKWAAARLPYAHVTEEEIKRCRAIGVQRKEHGPLSAVVIFSNYREDFKTIEASVVIEDKYGMTKNVWRRMFAYPFKQLGCEVLYVSVPASNQQSLSLCEKLGFQCDGKRPKFLGNDDLVMFSLLKHQAGKWLSDKPI